MKHFLLDIEGTTIPISFVHEILFPYARERISAYLETYPISTENFDLTRHEFIKDQQNNQADFMARFRNSKVLLERDLALYYCYLIDVDRKFGPLKEIQGKIWKAGYESGELKSIVFDDVLPFLKKAKEMDIACHVYSSGSVEAQILIYKYSKSGDLTPFFKNYFDTSIGGKREPTSYKKIASVLNLIPENFVFFTDIKEEADAAILSGMEVVILDRPGNTKQPLHEYKVMKELLSFF